MMTWWPKNRAGSVGKGEGGTAAPGQARDVPDGFPRGRPGGDRVNPVGSGSWVPSTQAYGELGAWQPGRFLLGLDAEGRPVGVSDDRHILSVAGSRAGKGVSLIVPNLLFWPGSVIAVDPKGELATITAARRSTQGSPWAVAMGGDVHVLDPFERVTGPGAALRAAFNPLADLDARTDAGLEMAGQIADALVLQNSGDGAHWTQSARSFLRGLILYVAATEPPASKNLLTVRAKVTQTREELGRMLSHMGSTEFDGTVIKRAGDALSAKPDQEKYSILSTCDVQTDFLEGEGMRRVLSRSDFRMEELKEKRVTVYLCLPATRLGTHGRWLRLMMGLALEAMERTGPIEKGKPPVLFVLDEFAALDHMASIEKAAGQIAGFGVKLWPVIQDLTQLKRDYKEAWETFMGNAGLLTFFGNTDLTTLEHISKRLGVCEVIRPVVNVTETWQRTAGATMPDMLAALTGKGTGNVSEGSNEGGNRSTNENLMQAVLMHPDEVSRHFAREAGNILAFIPDKPPLALYRVEYHGERDDWLFGGYFDAPAGMDRPRTTADERRAREDAAPGRKP